jgi:hypothetical protein
MRINTVIAGIQQLGERIEEQMDKPWTNPQSGENFFGAEIINRVNGLRFIAKQIRDEIPEYEARLVAARDELESLQKRS